MHSTVLELKTFKRKRYLPINWCMNSWCILERSFYNNNFSCFENLQKSPKNYEKAFYTHNTSLKSLKIPSGSILLVSKSSFLLDLGENNVRMMELLVSTSMFSVEALGPLAPLPLPLFFWKFIYKKKTLFFGLLLDKSFTAWWGKIWW